MEKARGYPERVVIRGGVERVITGLRRAIGRALDDYRKTGDVYHLQRAKELHGYQVSLIDYVQDILRVRYYEYMEKGGMVHAAWLSDTAKLVTATEQAAEADGKAIKMYEEAPFPAAVKPYGERIS